MTGDRLSLVSSLLGFIEEAGATVATASIPHWCEFAMCPRPPLIVPCLPTICPGHTKRRHGLRRIHASHAPAWSRLSSNVHTRQIYRPPSIHSRLSPRPTTRHAPGANTDGLCVSTPAKSIVHRGSTAVLRPIRLCATSQPRHRSPAPPAVLYSSYAHVFYH